MSLLCLAKSLFRYRLDSFFTSYFHSLSHQSVSIVGGFTEPAGFKTDVFLNGLMFCFMHFFSIDFFSSWYCCSFYFLSPIIRSIFYFVFVIIDSKITSFALSGLFRSRLRRAVNLMFLKLSEKGVLSRSKV